MENKTLAEAMTAIQAHGIVVGKDASGHTNRYATLGKVIERLYPVMTENGVSIMQLLDNLGGEPALRTVIMHVSGDKVESLFPLQKAGLKQANDAQQLGAAISYARRYGITAAFGLAVDDDDAECLTDRSAPKQQAKPTGTPSERARAMPTPAKPDGAIPPQVLKVLDAITDMPGITAKCSEYKPMAQKEGWERELFRYWQQRDNGFKALQKEVFGDE